MEETSKVQRSSLIFGKFSTVLSFDFDSKNVKNKRPLMGKI